MKIPPLSLVYIYSENQPIPHKVNINQYLEENGKTIIKKEEIIKILLDDKAFFYQDSIRYYDNEEKAYFIMEDNFFIEISQENYKFDLKLLIKPVTHQKKQFKIENLYKEQSKIKEELQQLKQSIKSLSFDVNSLKKLYAKFIVTNDQNNTKILSQQNSFEYIEPNILKKQSTPNQNIVQNNDKDVRAESQGQLTSVQYKPDSHCQQVKQVEETSLSSIPLLPNYSSYQYSLPSQDVVLSDQNLFQISSFTDTDHNKQKLDFVVLYSEPLVRKKDNFIYPAQDPVNYEQECDLLKKMLEATGKEINIKFDIATKENLSARLSEKPTILHIICHGAYSKEKQKFYLAFEKENGELDELDSGELNFLLQSYQSKDSNDTPVQLVFISACHSQEIGEVFVDAGVPAVIAVHSDSAIEDRAAQIFARTFYRELINESSIEQSFNRASSVAIVEQDTHFCCCSHKHKPNCPWKKFQMESEETLVTAHLIHKPKCKCQKSHLNIHNKKCMWVQKFMLEFAIDEVLFSTQQEYEEQQNAFNSRLINSNEVIPCCCSPELPHHESFKFRKFLQFEELNEKVIFQNIPNGQLRDLSKKKTEIKNLIEKKIQGRNKDIYDLILAISEKKQRIIHVKGDFGCGKTALIQHFSHYVSERRSFQDGIFYINYDTIRSISYFEHLLYAHLGIYKHELTRYIDKGNCLFIFDNCDQLLKRQNILFKEKILDIIIKSHYVQIIIISNEIFKLNAGEKIIRLQPLSPLDAAIIIQKEVGDILPQKQEYQNRFQLGKSKLLNNPKIKLTPKKILIICQLIEAHQKEKNCFDIVEQILIQDDNHYTNNNDNDENSSAVELALEALQLKDKYAYDLLMYLACYPAGLFQEDLEQISLIHQEFIDWKKHIFNIAKHKNFQEINQHKNNQKIQNHEDNLPVLHLQKQKSSQYIEHFDEDFIKPDSYFWIIISKDNETQMLNFKASAQVQKYIKCHSYQYYIEDFIKHLQYMSVLSITFIQHILRKYDYHEQLIEFSAVSNYGIWSSKNISNDIKTLLDNLIDDFYLTKNNYDNHEINTIFLKHETNFIKLIDPEEIEFLIKKNLDYNSRTQLLDCLCVLGISIPTLFKIMSRIDEAIEIAESGLSICDLLHRENFDEDKIIILEIKIRLFLAGVYYQLILDNQQLDIYKNCLQSEINLIEKLLKAIEDEKLQEIIRADFILLQGSIYQKKTMKDIWQQFSYSKKNQYQLLKEACDLLDQYEDCGLVRSKIILILAQVQSFKEIYKFTLRGVEEAIEIFDIKGLYLLLLEAIILYARMKIELQVEKQIEQEKLFKAKTLITEKAFNLLSIVGDKKYDRKCTDLLNIINEKLIQSYNNVFIFMRSCPLVEQNTNSINIHDNTQLVDITLDNSQLQQSQKLQRVPSKYNRERNEYRATAFGFRTRTIESFRKQLIDQLIKQEKATVVKFELLTKETLLEILRKERSCRVLALCSDVTDNHSIIAEDKMSRAIKIPLHELKNQISKNLTIDVLILGMKNASNIAQFFGDYGFNNIIRFDFKQYDADFRVKRIQELTMSLFIQKFITILVQCESVEEAFNEAKNFFIYQLCDLGLISGLESYEKMIGQGPIIIQKIDTQKMLSLYNTNNNIYKIQSGKLDDSSSVQGITNINRTTKFITGRNEDIYKIIRFLVENKLSVNIYGESGIGKKLVANEVGYIAYSRGHFPDGVFLFSLKDIKKQIDKDKNLKGFFQQSKILLEEIKKQIGKISDNTLTNIFNERKMLLIFDDFHLIESGKVPLSEDLKQALLNIKLSKVLLVSEKQINLKTLYGYSHQLKSLNEDESKEIFEQLAVHDNIHIQQDDDNLLFNINEVFKKTKGIPRNIYKQYDEFKKLYQTKKLKSNQNVNQQSHALSKFGQRSFNNNKQNKNQQQNKKICQSQNVSSISQKKSGKKKHKENMNNISFQNLTSKLQTTKTIELFSNKINKSLPAIDYQEQQSEISYSKDNQEDSIVQSLDDDIQPRRSSRSVNFYSADDNQSNIILYKKIPENHQQTQNVNTKNLLIKQQSNDTNNFSDDSKNQYDVGTITKSEYSDLSSLDIETNDLLIDKINDQVDSFEINSPITDSHENITGKIKYKTQLKGKQKNKLKKGNKKSSGNKARQFQKPNKKLNLQKKENQED